MEPNGSKKTLTINGADGQPIELEPGGYYLNPKARCQRIMREPLSGEANRVHACLELATMGFRQELAVKLERGRQVPLTRGDIQQQTGLKLQNISRALSELESRGLAERRNKGDSRNSKFVIYSWAVPRESKASDRIARDSTDDADGANQLPPSFKPLLVEAKRLKLKINVSDIIARDSTFADGEQLARDYEALQDRIARYFGSNRARLSGPPIKTVGRKKGKIEHTHPTLAPSPVAADGVCVSPLPFPGWPKAPEPPAPSAAPSFEITPAATPRDPSRPLATPRDPLKRTEEFVSKYPDRRNAEDTRREYMRSNTPSTEDACHACLDRYRASSEVHRGIWMRGSRWLKEQARNGWAGDWPRHEAVQRAQQTKPDVLAITLENIRKNGGRL